MLKYYISLLIGNKYKGRLVIKNMLFSVMYADENRN